MKSWINKFPANLAVVVAAVLIAGSSIVRVTAAENDKCLEWAEMGECESNPGYMLAECPGECKTTTDKTAELVNEKIGHINSFFELEAKDIDENTVSFESFRGKVTVVTNVASFCGYTRSHYEGLVNLYDHFKNERVGFEILAFPCNQFGDQEPAACPSIKKFAQGRGVEFMMMNKIDVNGLDADPVYLYLRKVAGPPRITWNFGTYFVVGPDGTASSYTGVNPMDLTDAIEKAMEGDSGDEL